MSSTGKPASSRIAKLSIYGIARQHCGEELIINPIRWTARHLKLLRCSFERLLPEPLTPAAYAVTEADYTEERSGTPYLHEFFHYYYKAQFREQGIRLLLTADGCPLIAYDALGLYFNGGVIKRLQCISLCLRSSTHQTLRYQRPLVALIDRDHVLARRRQSVSYRLMRFNPPIIRLFNNRWRKVCPPHPVYDPYIVTLLIGVAQQKRRHFQEINCNREASKGTIFSQVLHTFYSKGQCEVVGEEAFNGWMYLYQANIPISFLDMFDDPKYAPSTPPSVSVQVITIRYSPLATLRARLLELMLPERLVSETYGLSARGQKRRYDGQGYTQPAQREAPAGEKACSNSCCIPT
ncbi:uncharacterized protein Triagg1_3673 [Trichoderma aggressivum f. europaeum]|uniref:Uncharacterized protein n=1 Tax=Trichoderma aggressivum f. europaeum TaxID=173218 RepID=A0AAE1M6J5_9HYPO|nr:hypothetical protein Triagg1_3673 [Trichoderma aggressivum f. europaeum]